MSRLLGTSTKAKQIFSPGPDVIRKLADYLHVSYEWLAIGRGPMRRAGFSGSALEDAMHHASIWGMREDAVEAIAKRFRAGESAGAMTVLEWLVEFDNEVRRLERAGVPRPDTVRKTERAARRERRAVRTLTARQAELDVQYVELQRRLAAIDAERATAAKKSTTKKTR